MIVPSIMMAAASQHSATVQRLTNGYQTGFPPWSILNSAIQR